MALKLFSLAICWLLCATCSAIDESGSIELSANVLPSCSQPLEELQEAIVSMFPSEYTVYINCLAFDAEGSLLSGVTSGFSPTAADLRFHLSCSSSSIIVGIPSSLPADNTTNLLGVNNGCLSCNTSLNTGTCSQMCTSATSFACERCYDAGSGPTCSQCIACTSLDSEECSTPSRSICSATCDPQNRPLFIIEHEDHNHCVCNGSFRLDKESLPTTPPDTEEFECEEGHEGVQVVGTCEADCDVTGGFERHESGICWACGVEYCAACDSDTNMCTICVEETVEYKGECYACPLAAIAQEAIHQEDERLEEERHKTERTIELAISLPIVVLLIIVFFVSVSVFAHHRYPHVSFHGQKRHRKPPTFEQALGAPASDEEPAPQPSVSHVWRPRPTIVLR